MTSSKRPSWSLTSSIAQRRKMIFIGILLLGLTSLIISFMESETLGILWNGLKPPPCDNQAANDTINKICSLYRRKEIVGDLCEPLCSQKLLEFQHCLNYKRGKFVAEVKCHDVCQPRHVISAVLKMTQVNSTYILSDLQEKGKQLLQRLQLPLPVSQMDIHEYAITAESLSIFTADFVEAEYGYFPRENQDLMSMLWGDYPVYFEGPKTNLVSARSYWSVLSQNEYRISQLFKEWDVFPTIYGSCGPLYLAQYAKEFKAMNVLFPFLSINRPPWNQRVKMAIEILHLVQRMDAMENPLHLCDIKSPHFGFTGENALKFLDADTVFTDATMLRDLGAPNCTCHEDCAFFDCEGWCQIDKGKCLSVRTNNNLQAVCAKVFRGSLLSATGGLLALPPPTIASKLNLLLDTCADGVTEILDGVQMKRPGHEVMSTLHRYLLEGFNTDLHS